LQGHVRADNQIVGHLISTPKDNAEDRSINSNPGLQDNAAAQDHDRNRIGKVF
jgi:hypothetical protein